MFYCYGNGSKLYFNPKKITHMECVPNSKIIYIWLAEPRSKPLILRFNSPDEYETYVSNILKESELI